MKDSNKWYSMTTDPLTADEIKGRIVVEVNRNRVESYDLKTPAKDIVEMMLKPECPALRYILIDPPEEEPMELDGVNGQVFELMGGAYSIEYRGGGHCHTFQGLTRAEAIHNANEFIRRLK